MKGQEPRGGTVREGSPEKENVGPIFNHVKSCFPFANKGGGVGKGPTRHDDDDDHLPLMKDEEGTLCKDSGVSI